METALVYKMVPSISNGVAILRTILIIEFGSKTKPLPVRQDIGADVLNTGGRSDNVSVTTQRYFLHSQKQVFHYF